MGSSTAAPVRTSRRNGGSVAHSVAVTTMAVAYGASLSTLPNLAFKDWANYLVYGEHSWARLLAFADEGVLQLLANEPVWLLLNAALATQLGPEQVARTMIFIPGTVVALLVLKSHPRQFVWLLVVLFLPMVVKNHLIHIRQGAAISVFLMGWFSQRRTARVVLFGIAPFIHISFVFVVALLFVVTVARRLRLSVGLRALFFLGAGLTISLTSLWVGALVGARQTDTYEGVAGDVSGLGFLFWAGVLGVMYLEGRRFLWVHKFETGAIVFYLSAYWLLEVAARIFENVAVLVLIAGLRMTGLRRLLFLLLVVAFGVLQWSLQADQPLLGFGID